MTLTIEYTAVGGAVLLGTAKGDGAAEALREAGCRWRWSRNIGPAGAWYIPHSRDRAPNLRLIEQAAAALRAAGFGVDVQIDAAPRAMDQAEADRAERMDGRADRLTDRAQRRLAESDARFDAFQTLGAGIPFGQPILVGHHSERRARADQRRLRGHFDAFCELRDQSAAAQAGADSAERHMSSRHNPRLVARRIEKLEADRRRVQRELDGYTRNYRNHDGSIWAVDTHPPAAGRHREQLDVQTTHLDEQLRYWRAVLDQARLDGTWHPVDRDTIHRGDKIKYSGRWWTVIRVNKTTVTVETDHSRTGKVPLREITEHQHSDPAAGHDTDAENVTG